MEPNRLAIDGLVSAPGRYRLGEMTIPKSKHIPPPPGEVPRFVDEMCEYVNEHWEESPVHLAAYVMWRLNGIHPFQNGNGRTARAPSYLVLCARLRHDLPGERTMPTHIASDKPPYYKALEAADEVWKTGELGLDEIEALLQETLLKQVREAVTSPNRSSRAKRAPSAPLKAATSNTAITKYEGMSPTVKAAVIAAGAGVIVALITIAAKCFGGAG